MQLQVTVSDELKSVIRKSWFKVDDGIYAFARAQSVADSSEHLMVIREEEEITVVTREENLSKLTGVEANQEKWKLITIRCGQPFYCVGFIANITAAIAAANINIVILSTFSNDLVFVTEADLPESIKVLSGLGFSSI